jgi:hypothetical protein
LETHGLGGVEHVLKDAGEFGVQVTLLRYDLQKGGASATQRRV